jgi:hypothetical protein
MKWVSVFPDWRRMVSAWLKSEERERRKKVRLDRAYLETKTKRFLRAYLAADEKDKPQFYRAVESASQQCWSTDIRPAAADLEEFQIAEDAQIAEATSNAAMKIVLSHDEPGVPQQDGRTSAFVTDAYATVAVAYHRAAGIYAEDKEMLKLGTAAVHLLTIAKSYMLAKKD